MDVDKNVFKIIKRKKNSKILDTFKLSEKYKDVCILHLFKCCKYGDMCKFKHIHEFDDLTYYSIKLYKDFTFLENVNVNRFSIFKFIHSNISETLNKKIVLNLCIPYTKGKKCNNVLKNRYIKMPIIFKDKNIDLYMCYSDFSKFKSYVPISLHIDFVINETSDRFIVNELISELYNIIDFTEKKKIIKDFEYVKKDFPKMDSKSVSSNISSISKNSTTSFKKAILTKQYKQLYKPTSPISVEDKSVFSETKPRSKIKTKSKPKYKSGFGDVKPKHKSIFGDAKPRSILKKSNNMYDILDDKEELKKIEGFDEDTMQSDIKLNKNKLMKDSKINTWCSTIEDLTVDDSIESISNDITLPNINWSEIADSIFSKNIEADESIEDKVERLEIENVILFKRNTDLSNEIRLLKVFNSFHQFNFSDDEKSILSSEETDIW